ncbi:MAG: sigma 54-interacting transcriptional regulator [Desulfobacterales bacterium]
MLKILIIDDEEGIRKLLSISLKSEGYDVITAEDGKSGIELFEKETPSIILIDFQMPGMDGIDVLRRVKQINPDVEVIILTAYGGMDLAVKSLQLEASDFITKPINNHALSKALGHAEAKLKIKQTLKDYTYHLEKAVKEKSEELDKAYKEMETICDITSHLSKKKILTEALDFIIGRIKHILKFTEAIPVIFNEKKDEFIEVNGYRCPNIEDKEELITAIASMTNPMDIVDLRAKGYSWLKSFDGYNSMTIAPINNEGDIIGGLILFAFKPGVFSRDDLRFIYLMLSQVAGDLRRIALNDDRLKKLNDKFKMFSGFGGIIGKDHKMRQIYHLIVDIAPTKATVLIQGESGSGKELIAKAIHLNGHQKDKSFVVVNCSAYPHTLLESELFGHEKGAFTGAAHQRIGRFELANGGTLFLDEIGEIPLMSQVKLLRFLQFQKFERLGGTETIEVNVRIIAATNKDLQKEVEKGNFREDLYYRLNVIPVNIPPLRARKIDISILFDYFLKKLNSRGDKKIKGISSEATRLLMNYNWPGNVRELENIIEHSFILTKGKVINEQYFPFNITVNTEENKKISSFQENERRFLAKVLQEYKWNKSQVAKKLNISRSTLYAKLKKYNINSVDK